MSKVAIARVCALVVALSLVDLHRAHAAPSPLDLAAVRFAPSDRTRPKPLFVYVHGMCDDADRVCPKYATAVGARGFLVCPRGNVACKGGGATWAGDARSDNVYFGIEATMLAHPNEVDTHAGVLIGFSLGAAVALDFATQQAGWWKGLVLVASMTVEPDVAALQRAGIRRVVLAVGDLDAARPHMRAVEARLRAEGMETLFVSLGKIGHVYPKDLTARMGPALAWAQGDA